MLTKDKDGITTREHLEQVKKMTGRAPEGLENPHEFPKSLAHVWSFFLQLHTSRTAGMSGGNPISMVDIQAWSSLYGIELIPNDIDLIKRLDNLYLSKDST